jgi:hypothetical protein
MTSTFLLRIVVYSLAPLLAGAAHVALDKGVTTAVRRWEVMLLYVFSLGVGIAGISSGIGHLFMSDLVAESIGWEPGSPFQLEMGFANLAIGVLGMGAVGRRDGFREATATAVTILGVGATIVHLMDIMASGNLAPGNTIQNAGNLLKPALVVFCLIALRRAERGPRLEGDARSFDAWRGPRIATAWWFGTAVATGFSAGFFAGQAVLGTLIGIVLGAGLLVRRVRQAG